MSGASILKMDDKRSADRQKALDSALAQIERQFGKGSIMKLGADNPVAEIEATSTGSLGLDIALGIGGLPKGRVEQGEALAHTKGEATGQSCIDCHGPDGNEPLDPTYPKLGGQYADYLAHSLQGYRDGKRAGSGTTDLMATQAKALTDQQIADLAAWYEAIQVEATVPGR